MHLQEYMIIFMLSLKNNNKMNIHAYITNINSSKILPIFVIPPPIQGLLITSPSLYCPFHETIILHFTLAIMLLFFIILPPIYVISKIRDLILPIFLPSVTFFSQFSFLKFMQIVAACSQQIICLHKILLYIIHSTLNDHSFFFLNQRKLVSSKEGVKMNSNKTEQNKTKTRK